MKLAELSKLEGGEGEGLGLAWHGMAWHTIGGLLCCVLSGSVKACVCTRR